MATSRPASSTNPVAYQAMMVLGCGVTMAGTLDEDARSSVELAVRWYRQGVAPCLIFSGAYTYHLQQAPRITECQAMKDYAASLGVPVTAILTEAESKDTLGNAFFTKTNLLLPLGIRRVAILKGPRQSGERMHFIFDQVFGGDVSYDLLERPEHIDDAQEKASLITVRRWLRDIAPGDDAALYSRLRREHPAYGSDAAAVQALQAELDATLRQLN